MCSEVRIMTVADIGIKGPQTHPIPNPFPAQPLRIIVGPVRFAEPNVKRENGPADISNYFLPRRSHIQ